MQQITITGDTVNQSLSSVDIPVVGNAGDYSMIDRSTNDEKLVELWAMKPRKSQSPNTTAQYRRQGLRFLAEIEKPIQAINYSDLIDWQSGLSGSINTRRLIVNAVKSLLSFAHQSGYIRVNPGVMLEPPAQEETKHRKMLTEADVIRLISHDGLSDRDRAIIYALYSTGCRVSELCAIQWRDVIEIGNRAEIVIRGKGGKTRKSGVSAGAYAAIQRLRENESEYVFISSHKRQMDRTTVNHLFTKLSRIVGKEISPHWLRHSHVSHALQRGGNAVDVQEQVGHSSLAVTTGYSHSTRHSSEYLVV